MSEPTPPVRIEIVPGALSAQVTLHDIASQQGPIACWSYVTEGLAAHQQAEIAFTLRRDPGEASDGFPEEPLRLFATIYQLAAGGQRVSAGAVIEFGETRFFGHHVLYAPAQPLAGVVLPSPCLAALLITADELRAARTFGTARVLARMGQAAFFYPFPPWADRRRRGLALDRTFEASVLSKIPRASTQNLRAVLHDQRITLSALRAEQPQWRDRLAQVPAAAPIALLTAIDPAANGCLTWVPGQKGPEAIVPPGSDGSRMSGCFVVFIADQPSCGGKILEDGFAIELTAEAWQALRAALGDGSDLAIPATGGGMSFALTWRDDADPAVPVPDPAVTPAAEPVTTAAARLAGKVALGPVRLLTSQDDFAARASAEELGQFCRELQRCAERVLADHDGELELRLEVICRPRSHRVGISHRGEVADETIDRLIDALEQLPSLAVRGEVSFETELTIAAAGPRTGFPA
jgi:hypothetical protein